MNLRYELSKLVPDAYEFGKANRDDYWKFLGPEVRGIDRCIAELERRVRWLESVLLEAEGHAWASELQDCANTVSDAVLIYPNKTGGEKRVKPTPKDFK